MRPMPAVSRPVAPVATGRPRTSPASRSCSPKAVWLSPVSPRCLTASALQLPSPARKRTIPSPARKRTIPSPARGAGPSAHASGALVPSERLRRQGWGPHDVQAGGLMTLHVVEHPLVAHYLTRLRDRETTPDEFREASDKIITLLLYEATRDLRTRTYRIQTPLEETNGYAIGDRLVAVRTQ